MDFQGQNASEQVITQWIEEHVGELRWLERDGRWRPAWYAEAERGGERLPIYIRGKRGGRFPPLPLSYEARVHQVFADCGVRVPRLYGYIDELPALVMERVPGGVGLGTARDETTRVRLREQLADQMRLMHEIDPELIIAAGAPRPADRQETTLAHYRQAEALYQTADQRLPAPDIEFVRTWLDRNTPAAQEDACVIAMDAGQFVFEGDELTAMLDFEFVTVGDRHVDFAALVTRDSFEPIGDLEQFYALYEARGGKPIDRRLTLFQHIPFVMYAPLEVAEDLARANPGVDDYFEYYCWHANGLQVAIEDIARYTGIDLAPYYPPPAQESRLAFALRGLATDLGKIPAEGEYASYRKRKVALAAQCYALREGWATEFEREYLGEVRALTGEQVHSEWEADVVLERFVKDAAPALDAQLLTLLHRRARRMMLPFERSDPALIYG